MAQTITIIDTDATETDFSEVDSGDFFKYDDEVYRRLKGAVTYQSQSYNCIKCEDCNFANLENSDKVKKYTSVEIKPVKTS